MPPKPWGKPWQVALLCVTLALVWQGIVAAGFFHGNWSGFFVAGDRFQQSPAVKAEESFVYPNSYGYDGQLYHAIAHDPLDLHGTDRFVDAPRLRYSRILIPGLSFLLGFGQLFWIDRAYRALELLFLFLGIACMASYLEHSGRSTWWGVAFLTVPGVFISVERQLTDLPLCALIVAALLCAQNGRNLLCWLALAAAGLDREMGMVAIAGFVLFSISKRQPRQAGFWALAALPVAAWYAYTMLEIHQPAAVQLRLSYPFSSVVFAFQHPQPYPFSKVVVHALHILDGIAIAGALLAFYAGVRLWTRDKGPIATLAFFFAVFGVTASASAMLDYTEVYNFGRQNSPLFLLLLLQSLQSKDGKLMLPLAMVLPRAILPMASLTWISVLRLVRG